MGHLYHGYVSLPEGSLFSAPKLGESPEVILRSRHRWITLHQSAAGDSNRLRVGEHPMVNTRVYQATGFLSHEIHEIQCNQQLQRWDANIYLVGGFKHDFLHFQIEQAMIPKPFRKNNNWLVVWNIWIIFPNSWDDDPIWRTHIFQRDWNILKPPITI